MPVLIGVDEAGYGPNYGPLVVAATAWQVPQPKRAGASPPPAAAADRFPDLYKLLRKAVTRTPDATGRKLAIADSKALYKAGFGVHQLERGVLAALAAMGPALDDSQCISRVAELLAATSADPLHRRRELACHFDDEQALPLETPAAEICRQAARLRHTCAENGVSLLTIRATLVYPTEFNALVEEYGTKGAALSHVTLGLVRRVVDEVETKAEGGWRKGEGSDPGSDDAPARSLLPTAYCPPPTLICLDKHGGRNRYAALVQHHFPESWIETVSEARAASRYRWRHGERDVDAIFRIGCEELLPTALASMTAKYHREVAMRAFNAFWTARLPTLRPTAGYPGDATGSKRTLQRCSESWESKNESCGDVDEVIEPRRHDEHDGMQYEEGTLIDTNPR